MAKGKRFDKKNAKTFSIVHRSHEDALYYDNDASKHVLVEVAQRRAAPEELAAKSGSTRAYDAKILAEKLGPDGVGSVRENEGLAAQYGIFYDDSKYDYMQHLRPMGQAPDSVFLEAAPEKKQEKKEPSIEALIRDALPSEQKRKVTHDDTENIPRELQGFNPEMDPRLREVLEALEDEAYVENDAEGDGDIFGDLLQSGEVEDGDDDDEYDEWDMDNWAEHEGYHSLGDERGPGRERDFEQEIELENPYAEGEAPEEFGAATVDQAWERDFAQYKKSARSGGNEWDSDNEFEDEEEDVVAELPKKGKSKTKARRKMGAMTDTSAFSMTLSACFRSEGLTLLDDRYEQMAKKFEREDADEYREFDMKAERGDFENLLDDFLDNYELESGGRRLVAKDKALDAMKLAADSVSRGKLAQRRKKQALALLGSLFKNMKI